MLQPYFIYVLTSLWWKWAKFTQRFITSGQVGVKMQKQTDMVENRINNVNSVG